MLKITIEPEAEEIRLKLEGDLAGTWVADLEECWRDDARLLPPGRRPGWTSPASTASTTPAGTSWR